MNEKPLYRVPLWKGGGSYNNKRLSNETSRHQGKIDHTHGNDYLSSLILISMQFLHQYEDCSITYHKIMIAITLIMSYDHNLRYTLVINTHKNTTFVSFSPFYRNKLLIIQLVKTTGNIKIAVMSTQEGDDSER